MTDETPGRTHRYRDRPEVPNQAEGAAIGRWYATRGECLDSIERFRAGVGAASVVGG